MPTARRRRPFTPLRMARIMTYRTQEELAADVHVSRQTISSLENERSLPSVTLAIALARALDTTVEALWG